VALWGKKAQKGSAKMNAQFIFLVSTSETEVDRGMAFNSLIKAQEYAKEVGTTRPILKLVVAKTSVATIKDLEIANV
jgi:hypothetical protein